MNSKTTNLARRVKAFSLVEVVVAVGIFALAIVGVIGLLSPTIKSVGEVGDSEVASRLAEQVNSEIQRYSQTLSGSGQTSLDVLSTKISKADVATPTFVLYGKRDGSRVVLSTNADNAPTAATAPGIAVQDRYYLIEVTRPIDTNTLAYKTGSGFLVATLKISWPYRLPPDGAYEAPVSERLSVLFNTAYLP